jgi:prefoldin subunit 5
MFVKIKTFSGEREEIISVYNTTMTVLKRQYAINKKLANAYTRLKNANSALKKKNKVLQKKLNEISNERRIKRVIDKRNKNMDKWLKEQFARQRRRK